MAVSGGAGGSSASSSSFIDPNDVNSGTKPLSGFASQYNPSQLASIIWESPWAILPDVFNGINKGGAGYQALRDFGADPLTLYNIMQGTGGGLYDTSTGPGDYTNWLASLYKSMGSVGGRGFSGAELLNNVFHPGANTPLQNILNAGDASTQMRTLFNLLRDASNVGMNPLAARGYQAAVARSGDTALNQMLSSNANQGANNQYVYQVLRNLLPGSMTGG